MRIAVPQDFLWGAATSSHQVEGANRWNDWWAYEQAGRLPEKSGAACRHFELFDSDFDLALAAGHNAHRFSIEWSRIEPVEGSWNRHAIDHYEAVIDSLLARGLEPVPTLFHFTLPSWVAERGGWARGETVSLFARFVDRLADRLAGKVRYWVTINEPTVYVKHGYVVGDWPPCRGRAWGGAVRAAIHLARAHRAARSKVRSADPSAKVGFAHSAPLIQPCDPSSPRDRLAAWTRDAVLNRAFFRLLGAGPEPSFDFLGINYYTRTIVSGRGRGVIPFAGTECTADHHADRGARSDMGWEIYPDGLFTTLDRFSRYGVPILITENGVATTDEELRTRFLVDHVQAVARALEEGVDVRGYFYWSLMDNYEWTLGTAPRFGLFGVDFATQRRTARPIVDRFGVICRSPELGVAHPSTAGSARRGGHAGGAEGAARP